ncbi:hypothetical protein [Streptomyces pacificus]|nr:hypothetical protein [Streptomyces pacificus]
MAVTVADSHITTFAAGKGWVRDCSALHQLASALMVTKSCWG